MALLSRMLIEYGKRIHWQLFTWASLVLGKVLIWKSNLKMESMTKRMFLEKLDAEIAKTVTSQLLKDQVNSDRTKTYDNKCSRIFENINQFYGMSIKLSI